jgi:hypothetical protein
VNSLETLALVVATLWLVALTVAVVLVIRQIGLLTIRLTYSAPHGVADEHGPAIGSSVPETAASLLGLNGDSRAVVFLSSTCNPCRDFATQASADQLGEDTTILISGNPELARGVAALLPKGAESVLDPISQEVASAFGVGMVPFALYLSDGRVRAKTYLNDPDELVRLRTPGGANATTIELTDQTGGNGNGIG